MDELTCGKCYWFNEQGTNGVHQCNLYDKVSYVHIRSIACSNFKKLKYDEDGHPIRK